MQIYLRQYLKHQMQHWVQQINSADGQRYCTSFWNYKMDLLTQQHRAMTFVKVLASNSFLCSRYKRNERMCSTGATEHELNANVPRWYLIVMCTEYDTGSAI